MDDIQIKYFIEAALLAAGRPLNVDQLQNLFDGRMTPEKSRIRQAISGLQDDYEERGITITEVASGFRIQIDSHMAESLQKLWEERPPRYSRALFETLALIAYRQPMTRGEIEEIRGVSVSANITRTLLEREWVRIVGHRDVPGRPEMFGTTKKFLDYFGLKKLEDLPPLADLSDWESLRVQLNLPAVEEDTVGEPAGDENVTRIPMLQPEDTDDVDDAELPDLAEPEATNSDVAAPAANDGDVTPEEPAEQPVSDDDFEPIEVQAWPKPSAGAVSVDVVDDEGTESSVQSPDGSAETSEDNREANSEDNSRKDVDASLTGA